MYLLASGDDLRATFLLSVLLGAWCFLARHQQSTKNLRAQSKNKVQSSKHKHKLPILLPPSASGFRFLRLRGRERPTHPGPL
jgi:hypothetical protein